MRSLASAGKGTPSRRSGESEMARRVVLVKQREKRFGHRGVQLALPLDFHRRLEGDELGLDRKQLSSGLVLEDEFLADAEGLAVDLVDLLTLVVFDPEVFADRKQLALQLVASPGIARHQAFPRSTIRHGMSASSLR